jgi:hypothetical protein
VVLQEVDEGGRRQMAAGCAARLTVVIGRAFALIDKALGQASGQALGGTVGEVLVVGVRLTGQQDMQHVVEVVVPLGVEVARQALGIVRLVLKHQVDMALREARADLGGQAVEEGVVADRVDGVEAQAIEPEGLEPVERVVDEKPRHRLAPEGDRRAPGRVAALVEELGHVGRQVVPVRPEVIVDDVQQHHHAQAVGRVDQAFSSSGVP